MVTVDEGSSTPKKKVAEEKEKKVVAEATPSATGVNLKITGAEEGKLGTPDNIFFSHIIFKVQVIVSSTLLNFSFSSGI